MLSKRFLQCLLIAAAVLSFSLPGQAAMVGTAQLQSGGAAVDIGTIAEQRDWIREQLIVGGVGEAKAVERVAAMTDGQVKEIHERIDAAPAGGADALVVVIVVLIILEVMGYTDFIAD